MTRSADLDHLLAHAAWLRALASRLVGPASADDAVQDTLMAAMRTPPDPTRPARPWLGAVLRNIARMQYRGTSRRAQREEVAELAPAANAGPQEIVLRVELQRMLCEVVLALDEPYRRTLVMHYFDGLSLADIARTDDIPEATVRWRHREALARMRALLDTRSGGDRKAWVASLAPFAAPAKPVAVIAGGLLVKKLVIAIVAAIVAALIVWKVGSPAPAAPPTPRAVAKAAAHLMFGQATPVAGAPRAAIYGRVEGGERASITLLDTSTESSPLVVARQDGAAFEFRALAAGRYCVVATAGARTASACDLRLDAGARLEQNLELAVADARLHGTITEDGGPVARPVVIAQRYPQLASVAAVHGDEGGRYELALAPGWYRVTLSAEGYTAARHHVEVIGARQLDARLNASSTISGRVVDDAGRPVAGATVSTVERAGRAAKADPEGRFTLAGLRPGGLDLVAIADALVSAPLHVVVEFGETREIEIVVRPSRAAIAGRVVDEADHPVSGCRVAANGIEATTAADGTFRLTGIAAGTYDVTATAVGHVHAKASTLVGPDGDTTLVLRVARGITVTGTVRTLSGEAVAGATVASNASNLGDPRLDVRTDALGAFRIGPLPAGSAHLSAFHPQHGVTELVKLDLPPASSPVAELVFRASGSIDGAVTYDDGTPARGALVTITTHDAPARWSIVADDRGRFALGSLPAGKFSIDAAPPVAASLQTVLEARSAATVTVTAGASQHLALIVPGGSERITGRVVDPSGPIGGVAVWVERRDRYVMSPTSLDEVRAYTWPDGTFTLDDVPRGTYTVYAAHPARGTGELVGVAAGSTGVTIPLAASASVAGRVVDAANKPVRAFRVQWSWESRASAMGSVTSRASRMFESSDGTFTLTGLPPTAAFALSVETAAGATGELAPFALAAGQLEQLPRIVVVAMGMVRGRLVAGGAPVLGLSVMFERTSAPVDGAGRFEAKIPAGAYHRLNVQSDTQGYPVIDRSFTVPPGGTTDLGDVPVTLGR